MEHDASVQASRKKPPSGKVIVVTLLAITGSLPDHHRLDRFFRGLRGSLRSLAWSRDTRGYCRCCGSISGVDFSPGWDCFLSRRTGVVDVAALGTLVDDWPGVHQSDGGFLCAKTAALRPVDYYCEHEYCRRDPPLCTDSDRYARAFQAITLSRCAGQARWQT